MIVFGISIPIVTYSCTKNCKDLGMFRYEFKFMHEFIQIYIYIYFLVLTK